MNKKTINTYQSLGRIIINTVYQELSKNNGALAYEILKEVVYKKCIKQNPRVNKSFAMHKYDHGDTEAYWRHTYRWENIMDYYVNQQYKADLLNTYITDASAFTYCLTTKSRSEISLDERSLFDTARIILRKKYEQRLNAARERNRR